MLSNLKHTKEPWAVEISHNGSCVVIVETGCEYPRSLGQLVSYTDRPDINAAENARRIVACVNACANVDTKWLEHCAPVLGGGALFSLSHWSQSNQELRAQRDELLAALKGVVRVADRKTDEFDAAHTAIANAEA